MVTIKKYELKPGLQEILMPRWSRLLAVQTQQDRPYLWALVVDEAALSRCDDSKPFKIGVFGTDHPVPHDWMINTRYLGMVQLNDSVFHTFVKLD